MDCCHPCRFGAYIYLLNKYINPTIQNKFETLVYQSVFNQIKHETAAQYVIVKKVIGSSKGHICGTLNIEYLTKISIEKIFKNSSKDFI